jgi:hypothetical protein
MQLGALVKIMLKVFKSGLDTGFDHVPATAGEHEAEVGQEVFRAPKLGALEDHVSERGCSGGWVRVPGGLGRL